MYITNSSSQAAAGGWGLYEFFIISVKNSLTIKAKSISAQYRDKDNAVMEDTQNQVKYDGEFVLTREGSKDFGEISPEIAKIIRRQAGKIRLRIGEHERDKGNYGEKHIERQDRLQQLRKNGYENARDFVEDVAGRYTAIYTGESGRLTLYKKTDDKKGLALFVELLPSVDDDFYYVKTAMIARDSYFHNKKPLWRKPQSG